MGLGGKAPRKFFRATLFTLAIIVASALLCTTKVLEQHEKRKDICVHLFIFVNFEQENKEKLFVACKQYCFERN